MSVNIDNKITTIKIRFLLRNENSITVPVDINNEIKTFLYKVETSFLEDIKQYDDTFSSECLFEELINSFYFNEFMIQLFYENYEIFLASVSFELDGNEYFVSDVAQKYSYWLEKNGPRTTIDVDYSYIENDIYQFNNYSDKLGMNQENLEFRILGKENI